jgi:hypothetical protein
MLPRISLVLLVASITVYALWLLWTVVFGALHVVAAALAVVGG